MTTRAERRRITAGQDRELRGSARRLLLVGAGLLTWHGGWAWYLGHATSFGSWGYFEKAVRYTFSSSGLELYDDHPNLQFGPVTTAVAAPFVALGRPVGVYLAAAAMGLVGLLLLFWITGLDDGTAWRPDASRFLVTGLLVMPVWADLTVRNAHIDDVISLAFACSSLAALRRGHAAPAAVLMGLAVDAKPWALGFAVCLLALRRPQWPAAAAAFFVTVAAAWVPFFIADPRSTAALRFALKVDNQSVLSLIGLAREPMPGWVRPAQLALGAGLGLFLTLRRRPEAALLAVLAARVLLDPETHNYYAASVVVATAIADQTLRHTVPWITAVTFAVLWLPHRVPAADLLPGTFAAQRLAWAVATLFLLFAACLARAPRHLRASPGHRRQNARAGAGPA